jgi:hypothetical protein
MVISGHGRRPARHGRIGGLRTDPDLLVARRQPCLEAATVSDREIARSVAAEGHRPMDRDEADGGVYAVEWEITQVPARR